MFLVDNADVSTVVTTFEAEFSLKAEATKAAVRERPVAMAASQANTLRTRNVKAIYCRCIFIYSFHMQIHIYIFYSYHILFNFKLVQYVLIAAQTKCTFQN